MLDSIKRFLYKRKEYQTNARILGVLSQQLQQPQDIYLVHQMGRVASMTLTNSLQAAIPNVRIYHTHYLNPKTLQERRAVEQRLKRPITQRHFRVSELLADEIQHPTQPRRWKIVTIFRDPVARNISAFYLSLEDYMPRFQKEFLAGKKTVSDFRDTFLNNYNQHYALNWFEREVNQVFRVDIYATPFDREKGYGIVSGNNLDLLMIKLEKLDDSLQPGLKEFLGLEKVERIDTHVTKKDEKDGVYAQLMQSLKLPEDYLDDMYGSIFARHFYSPEELEGFRNRWLVSSV